MIPMPAIVLSLTLLAQVAPPSAAEQDRLAAAPQTLTRREMVEHALRSFDQAVALKDASSPQGQQLYAQALDGFETLIKDGIQNPHIFYNAANAEVRLGMIGAAIADYRRALQLQPGNEDVRANLQFARSLSPLQIEPSPVSSVAHMLFFWHFRTASHSRLTAAIIVYVAFWILLIIKLRSGRPNSALSWTAATCAFIALVVGGSAVLDLLNAKYHKEGVTIADSSILRKGNGEGYQPQLVNPLPQGVEMQIIESRDDIDGQTWHHVELPDGKNGWIRADHIEVI